MTELQADRIIELLGQILSVLTEIDGKTTEQAARLENVIKEAASAIVIEIHDTTLS